MYYIFVIILFFCFFDIEMRIVTSIFLIFIVSLVSLQEASFYAFFKLNQDYFAKNLCVEKGIKESKCKGHCHLTKMVNKSKELPSPDMPLPIFEPTKIELFILTNNFEINPTESRRRPCFDLEIYHDSEFFNSIFHPPTRLSFLG